MIRFHSGTARIALLVLAALVALSGAAVADHHQDGDQEKKVHVKKIVKKCKGDDCGELHEAHGDDFEWVSEDGEERVIVKKIIKKCDGDDCGDEKRVRKIMIDDDGEVHELLGDDNIWVEAGGDHVKKIHVRKSIDCEGDDCTERKKRIHKIMIGEDGEVHELHGKGMVWMGGPGGRRMHLGAGHPGGGFLGVGLTELTNELREHFGVAADTGVMVASVVDGSPAAKAGLTAGDIITAVNGDSVESGSDLAGRIRKLEDGANADLEVWRDGGMQSMNAAVEVREAPARLARAFAHDVSVDCDDEDDCNIFISSADGLGDLCDGDDDCEVKIECQGEGDCSCTVNGEDADCDELHEMHGSGGE